MTRLDLIRRDGCLTDRALFEARGRLDQVTGHNERLKQVGSWDRLSTMRWWWLVKWLERRQANGVNE